MNSVAAGFSTAEVCGTVLGAGVVGPPIRIHC